MKRRLQLESGGKQVCTLSPLVSSLSLSLSFSFSFCVKALAYEVEAIHIELTWMFLFWAENSSLATPSILKST